MVENNEENIMKIRCLFSWINLRNISFLIALHIYYVFVCYYFLSHQWSRSFHFIFYQCTNFSISAQCKMFHNISVCYVFQTFGVSTGGWKCLSPKDIIFLKQGNNSGTAVNHFTLFPVQNSLLGEGWISPSEQRKWHLILPTLWNKLI